MNTLVVAAGVVAITLAEVATEKNSTLIFPIPVELLAALQSIGSR